MKKFMVKYENLICIVGVIVITAILAAAFMLSLDVRPNN